MISVRLVNSSDLSILQQFTNNIWNSVTGLMLFDHDELVSCLGYSIRENIIQLEIIFTDENKRKRSYATLLLLKLLEKNLPALSQIETAPTVSTKSFFINLGFIEDDNRLKLPITKESIVKLKLDLLDKKIPADDHCKITLQVPLNPIVIKGKIYEKWALMNFFAQHHRFPAPIQDIQMTRDELLSLPMAQQSLTTRRAAFEFVLGNQQDSKKMLIEAQQLLQQENSQELSTTATLFLQNKYPRKFFALNYQWVGVPAITLRYLFTYVRLFSKLMDDDFIFSHRLKRKVEALNDAMNLTVPLYSRVPAPIFDRGSVYYGLLLTGLSVLLELAFNHRTLWPHNKNRTTILMHTLMQVVLFVFMINFSLCAEGTLFDKYDQFNSYSAELSSLANKGVLNNHQLALYQQEVSSVIWSYLGLAALDVMGVMLMHYLLDFAFSRRFQSKLETKTIVELPQLTLEHQVVMNKLIGDEPNLFESEHDSVSKKMA